MHRLLDKMNDRQREAVTTTDGPLLVVAGAGSGKTRVLTHRLAYLIAERKAKPAEVLAVTFTNKAAGEMRKRIADLLGFDVSRLWVSTFHSFCARFLRLEAGEIGYPAAFTILDSDDSRALIKRSISELGLNGLSQCTPEAIQRSISRAKNQLATAEEFAVSADGHYEDNLSRIFTHYQNKLRASSAFDFDDLIAVAVRLLEQNDRLRHNWQNRFRYLMVDEYQDTNHAQYRLLKALTGPDRNLAVVGDEDQSIYGWRGADISNILNFEVDFPGAAVIKLEQNYRSTQVILSAASAVIKNNLSRKDKTLWTEIPGGEKIVVGLHEAQGDEAEWVVDRVEQRNRAYSLSEIVILYRTNAQSRAFEETLRRKNIPYQIVGGLSFYQRREIKDIVAYLKLMVNPDDEAAFVRICNFPRRAIGETSLARLTEYAAGQGMSLLRAAQTAGSIGALSPRAGQAFRTFADLVLALAQEAGRMPLDRFIQKVIDETGLGKALAEDDPITGEARLDNLNEFVVAAADFAQINPEPTLADFLAEVTLYSDLDAYSEIDEKLTLMTLHNAKGLEFDAVFMVGLEEGLFPLASAFDDPAKLEEERRLFYVGTTRARKELFLTGARFRHRFGGSETVPSRFLGEIPEELCERCDYRSYRYEFGPVKRSSRPPATRPEGVYYEYDDDSPMRPGCRVHHPTFGQGRVINVSGSGEQMRIDVDFASCGPKKMIARYARLTIVDAK